MKGVQNQREHNIILNKYGAMHKTTVSENYSSPEMLTILIKVQTVCFYVKKNPGKVTHIISKRTK